LPRSAPAVAAPALCQFAAVVSASSSADEIAKDDSAREEADGEAEAEADNVDEEALEYARTYHINLQLADLANQAARQRHRASQIGAQALELFDTLKQHDTVSYNSILKVLAKVSPSKIKGVSASQVAQDKFMEMKQLHEEQRRANQLFYEQLEQEKDPEMLIAAGGPPRIRVKPNVRSYATLMDAISRTGTAEAATLCEDLLIELQQRYHKYNQLVTLEPNLIVYNTVLSAWAKVGGTVGATRCLRLLESMPVIPDRISYNAALHAIAKSSRKDAGERAEQILKQAMPKAGVVPNARSYTTCMDAWGRSGRPDRAHALLRELTELARHDESLKPNTVSYSTVIHAYAVAPSKSDDARALTAYRVFCDMQRAGIAPNLVVYNTMLNCCATSTQHPELIEMVEILYHQFVARGNITDADSDRTHESRNNMFAPDHVTFATVLKACSNLLPRKGEEDNPHPHQNLAPTVFREACARGCVTAGVMWQLRQAVPMDTYRILVGGDDRIAYHELPPAWTRNAPEERKWRRSRSN